MKVLLISIGTELLSDILDTNASLAARRFQESHIPLVGIYTLTDDQSSIEETLQGVLDRIDIVVTIGGLGTDDNDLTHKAIAHLTGRKFYPNMDPPIENVLPLGGPEVGRHGFLLEVSKSTLICLPGKPRDMAYLLETEVLPFLQRQIIDDAAHGWALVRTAGSMESTLAQKLMDLNLDPNQRVSFSSFAGQTDIGIWVEGDSQLLVNEQLEALVSEVLDRVGDQVYGRARDRLEDVLLKALERNQISTAIAECFTGGTLAQTLGQSLLEKEDSNIIVAPTRTGIELNDYLDMDELSEESDLTNWCCEAAERLREKTKADIGLIVYNNVAPGGIQLLITLASSHGVSVIQRSFGGHPDNISEWASTLGMVHLRRWLLTHYSETTWGT